MSNFLYNSYRFTSANSARVDDPSGKTNAGQLTADGRFGFDCSGFVNFVLNKSGYDVGKRISTKATFTKTGDLTSAAAAWQTKIDTGTIQAGDLVYFSGTGHVGFVVSYDPATKTGIFRSSSSSKGIVDAAFTIDPTAVNPGTNQRYYWGGSNRFQAATRVTVKADPGSDIWKSSDPQPAVPPLQPAPILSSGDTALQATVWLNELAAFESSGNPAAEKGSHLGLYQMGLKNALVATHYVDAQGHWLNKDGIDSIEAFKNHPDIQKKAALEYLDKLRTELQAKDANGVAAWDFIGQVVDGRLITEAGLLAAAWEPGATGIRNMLVSAKAGSGHLAEQVYARLDTFRGTLAPGASMANTLGSTVTSDQYQFGTSPGAGRLIVTYGDNDTLVAVFANGKRLTLPANLEALSVTPDGQKLSVTVATDDGLLITRDYNASGRITHVSQQTAQGAATDGVTVTTPRNPRIFDLTVDLVSLKPASPDSLGTCSGGWGLLGAGAGYNYSETTDYVNRNGWAYNGASSLATGGIRSGNYSLAGMNAVINSLRLQTDSLSSYMAAQMPAAAVTWSYGEVYHGGGSLTPSYGINLYDAAGRTIGFIATDSDPILQDRNGTLVQILAPIKGQTYLYSQPGNIGQGVRGASPVDDLSTQLIDVPIDGASIVQTKDVADHLAYTDPLSLDANNDGVRLSAAPVSFDLDADGAAESLPWTAPTDPLLVMDVNGNGRIDNGSELLDLTNADAPVNLLSLDDNADGKLDANDSAYWKLELWSDRNQDGYASAAERQSLAEAGIASLDLAHLQTGSVAGHSGVKGVVATYSNGSTRTLWDVPLQASAANPTTSVAYAAGIDKLTGSGQVALVAKSALGIAIDLAGSGADQAIGGMGDDTLTGTANDDWLIGGQGSDKFSGDAGNDLIVIDADDKPSNLDGGAGIDTVLVADDRGVLLNLAQANVEVVYGGYGNDVFIGGGADNVSLWRLAV